VHNLSPGLVLTDLLLKDSNVVARRFFNALAEEAPTVAAALVPRIRSVQVCSFTPLPLSPCPRPSFHLGRVWDGEGAPPPLAHRAWGGPGTLPWLVI
jgi:hypothetical protein